MTITIKDIARKADVSIATVSRVLNNSKPVSPELRKRVMKVVEETSYQPNALARGLIKNKSGMIGVIIPDISNETFANLIKGIEGVTDENDYTIIVSNSEGSVEKELELFNLFRVKKIDGVIYSGSVFTIDHKEFLEKYRLPTVIVSQNFPEVEVPSVTIDDFQAGYDAVEYLIDLGHKRIGMITGPLEDLAAGMNRYRGYTNALREAGLEENKDYVTNGDFSINSGYRAMKKIISSEPSPTAVFAASDKMAIGAMNYCFDNNIKIPGDISIIGFDDIEMASAVRPTLSTIHQNREEIGKIAANHVLDLINEKEDCGWNNIQAHYKLITRDSTASVSPDY